MQHPDNLLSEVPNQQHPTALPFAEPAIKLSTLIDHYINRHSDQQTDQHTDRQAHQRHCRFRSVPTTMES